LIHILKNPKPKPKPKYKRLKLTPKTYKPFEFKKLKVAHPLIQKVLTKCIPLIKKPKYKKIGPNLNVKNSKPKSKGLNLYM
jgi:hypothetical protein